MRRWKPPEIEDVSERFCGCRRKHMIPLAVYNSDIALEWCYEKNCGWGPEDFSHASTVRAWWICSDCRREYKSQINNRVTNLSACPYCASKKVCEDNALAVLYPSVSREWHPTKNGELKLSDVMYASAKKFWWQCASCKHSWQARIADRTQNDSCCPACYEARMEYARQHPRARIRGHVVLSNQRKKIPRAWYDAGRIQFTPLSNSHPHIAKQWHPTANGNWTPNDFAYGSEAIAWWKCNKGPDHEWQSPIYSRTGKNRGGCPFCNGKKISVTNSLKSLFPEVAAQWHPSLNGNLKPKDVAAHSNKKVWWLCTKGEDHVWKVSVSTRTEGTGCPFCGRKRIGKDNNLKALFPQVAAQWHPKKNGKLKPEDIAACSSQRVWWICPKGPDHEWQATPANRTGRNSGCPACAGMQVSVTNSLSSLYPQIAKEWHITRNGKLRPSDVPSGSSKLAWWKCRREHVWRQAIHIRTGRSRGCQKCKESSRRTIGQRQNDV